MASLSPNPNHVSFASSTTPSTGNKYAKRNFSFEVKQISLSQKPERAPVTAVFCTVNVNGGEKAFSSSIFEPRDKGKTCVYTFSSDEAVLSGLVLDTSTNSVRGQLKIYPTSHDGELLGEAAINISLGSSKTREGSATLTQQKRAVGKVIYNVVKAEEAFFEDSASEDGDQAPPTPSPMPTTSRTMPPSSIGRRPVDRVLDFGQQSGPRPTTRSLPAVAEGTQTTTTNEPPADDTQASAPDSQYMLFAIIAALVFLLGMVVGFLPLLLITKQETQSLASISGNPSMAVNSDSSALSRAIEKAYNVVFNAPSHPGNQTHSVSVCIPSPRAASDNSVSGLVLSSGQGMYVQWQDVGGSTLNRTSCLVWNSGPFGSGNLGLETCSEANSWWRAFVHKDKMLIQHKETAKCLQVKNTKSKQSGFSLQACRDNAWSFVNYSLMPAAEAGNENENELSGMVAKQEGGGKQTVLWKQSGDLADTRPLNFVLVVPSATMMSVGNQSAYDQFQVSKRLFHSVMVIKENPVVVAP
eukprot:gene38866-47275_t